MLSSLLFPVYKLSRENTQPENKFDNVFEKVKGRGGWLNSKQNKWLCRSSRPKDSIKKVLWEIQVFPCEFCEICKNTFFAEHFRTTASDYSSISNNSEGAIWTVNYNTEIKAH